MYEYTVASRHINAYANGLPIRLLCPKIVTVLPLTAHRSYRSSNPITAAGVAGKKSNNQILAFPNAIHHNPSISLCGATRDKKEGNADINKSGTGSWIKIHTHKSSALSISIQSYTACTSCNGESSCPNTLVASHTLDANAPFIDTYVADAGLSHKKSIQTYDHVSHCFCTN
ncbi:hypothetical protein GW750_09040 [bacterium]|nr:hypothetical protein [bacterium]